MKPVRCGAFLLLSGTCTAQSIASHPNPALSIHPDIVPFWKAFDRMEQEGSRAFAAYYLRPGSRGVQHQKAWLYGTHALSGFFTKLINSR